MRTPQIEPITEMARNHKGLLRKVADGPVILANRSRKTAVVLAIADYESLVSDQEELHRLQRLIQADQAAAEMDAGQYTSFTPEQILAMGE